MGSGLYGRLTDEGLLVEHEEVDPSLAAAPDAYRVLKPRRIGFISYPYEWCFGQLRAAALLTLRAQRMAMEHGMSLRDASAYNVQLQDGRPVLIDLGSFGRLREGRPWVAYRQFCQHFLAPLAVMSYVDVRLGQLFRVHLDGMPLDLAASLLPARARGRPPLLLHVFGHARAQTRHAGGAGAPEARVRGGFGRRAFEGLLGSLEAGVERLAWEPSRSSWTGYYDESAGYTERAREHKTRLVEGFIERVRPSSVWDLGANTGMFGRLAADRGIPTVCLDADPSVVEANWSRVQAGGERNLLPLVQDLANPSPAIGWRNGERRSLAQRGPADMALALAVVHHLAIGNNVPLEGVADFLREVSTWLAVEFVPKTDPMVRRMLATREDVFPDYTEARFRAAFERRFEVVGREALEESERVLYLMRGR